MKQVIAAGLTAVMLVAGITQFASAKVQTTELFGFDQSISVFDKTSGEEIAKTNIPSGSKIGTEGNLATWGMNSSNSEALSASVVSDESGAAGDAFKIGYSKTVAADSGEFLKIDSVSVDYTDITDTKPLILEFRMKAEWVNTASMNACIDVVPVIKPETGNVLEGTAFTQQSVQTANNGKWLDVKYIINKAELADNTVKLTFDRYVGAEKQYSETKTMASGSGEGAKIIGIKIRPRARATSYNENGYMNIAFDGIRLYREETVIPTGTKWGEDLTVNGENINTALENGTVIGDSSTVTEYKLANSDGTVEGYSAQISDNNSELIIKNVSSSDGYKSTLTPVTAKEYTTADIPENGALVYEAKYKIEYELNGTVSYSAVQMFFDFYRNADNKTMQFAVPATKKASGEYVTVKVIIPKGTFEKTSQPYLFVDNSAIVMNTTISDLESIKLRRVVFSNKARTGQSVGEEQSAAVLTLDYLDQYVIDENGAYTVTADDLADEIPSGTVGVNFTGNHYVDKTTVTKAVLKKKSAGGGYEALETNTYGIKSTGDKTFYMGFGGSLLPGEEYEIDLSAVKDIYGNSVNTSVFFKTSENYKWLECSASESGVVYNVQNNTNSDAAGNIFAAVYDEQSGILENCAVKNVSVSANGSDNGIIQMSGLVSGKKVYLFFWNNENISYADKNTVTVQ